MRELALAVLLSMGCRGERGTAQATTVDAASCTTMTAEKLGIPFVRVCPPPGFSFEPFWIAAAPLGCSAGSHTTVPCPMVVPIAHADIELTPRLAAIVELSTANRLCAMRFAGRLPTRTERIFARESQGLSTLVVQRESSVAPTRDEVRELAEWVTEEPWDQPTTIAPSAGPGLFPLEGRADVDTRRILACRAKRASIDGIDIGDTCLAGDCVIRSAAAHPLTFALSCEETTEPPLPLPSPEAAAIAAFRCVLPATALTLDGG